MAQQAAESSRLQNEQVKATKSAQMASLGGVVFCHGACAVSWLARHGLVLMTQQARQGTRALRFHVLGHDLVGADRLVMEMAAESPRAQPEAAAAAEHQDQGRFVVDVSAAAVLTWPIARAVRREAM